MTKDEYEVGRVMATFGPTPGGGQVISCHTRRDTVAYLDGLAVEWARSRSFIMDAALEFALGHNDFTLDGVLAKRREEVGAA